MQENRKQNLEQRDQKRQDTKKQEQKKQEQACPVFKKCGGCRYLDLSYEKQVKKKAQ